jgi:hypothetical protein
MNYKGQSDILALIPVAVAAIFVIIIVGMVANSLTCTNEKSQITQLNGIIAQKNIDISKAYADTIFYKNEYEKLRDYNITKQDFIDLKIQINDLNYNYTKINNNMSTINQILLNNYNAYNFSFALNLALLPLTLLTFFDFAFLNFKYSNKVRHILVKKYKSTIEIIFKKKE